MQSPNQIIQVNAFENNTLEFHKPKKMNMMMSDNVKRMLEDISKRKSFLDIT